MKIIEGLPKPKTSTTQSSTPDKPTPSRTPKDPDQSTPTHLLALKGKCFSSKIDKYKYILVKAGQRPGIEFVMAKNNLWTSTALMLNTRFDLPDAHQLNHF